MEKKFELIEHTADVGVNIFGKNLEELFENAAFGMYNIICSNFEQILPKINYLNSLNEIDLETLLVSFLNDLLFQTFTNKILFCKFSIIELKEKQNMWFISYECSGEEYQKDKHGILTELKSATFHQLKIKKENNLYTTTIIFDT